MSQWPEWTSPDGRIRLINADCLEVRDSLPLVDAVISDPPYGIAHIKGTGGKGKHDRRNIEAIIGDDEPFDPSPWLEYQRVVLWGANHFAMRLPHGRWLAWNKLAGLPEFDSFSDVEFAWMKGRGKDRIFSHLWKGICQDSEKCGALRVHPTQKPVALMRWCIEQAEVEACETILDPFAGSCTTAVACIRTGRRCIAIEKEPKYYQIGIERCKREYERTALFDHAEAKAKQLEFA